MCSSFVYAWSASSQPNADKRQGKAGPEPDRTGPVRPVVQRSYFLDSAPSFAGESEASGVEEDGQQEGSGGGGEGWQAAIEWDGIAKLLVSEEARMEFSSLCRAFDEITHALQTEVGQGFFLSYLFFLFIIIIIVF